MNKIFKVIWSKSKQCYIVVSEMAKNHSGKKKIVVASILAAMAVGADMSVSVQAVDEGTAKPGGIALGSGSFAGSDGSIALGKKSYAVGTQRDGTTDPSIAIGQRAVAIGNSSLAVGLDTDIRNSYAVAVGRYATVNGDYGIGMGFKSVATEHATAVGESARSKKMGAAAYGVSARGYSQGGVAIGIQSLAGANTFNADGTPKTFIWDDDETTISNYQKFGDVSIGLRTMATGGNATALGRSAAATAANSIAIGGGDGNKLDDNKERTQASAEKAAAIGYSAFASGTSASALGTKAKASAENAAAIGTGAKASANDAFAAGTGAEASEANATALGKGASAEKADAIAIGTGATSGGTSGIAMGNDAQAQAKDTIAVGSSSRASNDNDSAFGNAATAAGSGSTAIGYQANTTAANSTAIGAAAQSTKASATALGNGAKAFSTSGIAIGEGATVGIAEGRTTAGTTPAVDASNSIAIGKNAKVLAGSGSIALGANTQITASDVATSSGSAQKTYPYMLTNTQGTDAVADKENGIVAIGTKRSSTDTGFARRLTGVAGGVSDYDAVNLKQAKAIESSLKKGERHIKAASYTPNGSGTITLNYVDGENNDVSNETATITDVAKKSDEWILRTQDGTTKDATPQTVTGVTKKAVTLKAGDNIAIDNSSGVVTIKAKNVVTSITSGDSTALTVSPSNGAVTITPNIASSVGASGQDGKLVTSGIVKTALDLKVNKTDELHVKAGNYTVGDDGNVSITQENANSQEQTSKAFTIKDIAKKSVVDGINTTVGTHTTQISNLTTAVGGKVSQSDFDTFKAKAITFKGDDNTGVARTLGTTLTVKGGANYTSTTTNTNIQVVKDGSTGADGLLVKLSDTLTGIKSIAGDEKNNLFIKNGTNTITITPGKGDDKGTVNFGDAKVIASNLEADITYRANSVADTAANTVKLKKGLNFVAATDATTSAEGPKVGLSITTGTDGLVTFGLDKATREKVDNAADKNLSNLSDDGKGKVTELAKAAAKETVKVADGINTTVDTDTTTTEGVTTYKVNANDTKVAITGDGLAISGGDLGATNRVREYTLDLSATTKGKLTAVGNLANVIGGTTITTDGTVTGPTFNITNATGGTDTANTLKDAIDKLNKTNEGQNTTISNLTTTVTNNYNDLSNKITNAGTAATAAATTKGLNFTGDDTTDNGKVHRDLGDTLTIKGGENFTRGASGNNIKVVKTSNDLAVKLAENLGNIKEIAGDGTHDLVIKNGDTKVTVKAPKDGNKGSIDFGDTKLVTNNLDANISYKAGTETDKNTVKLQDGFNFVAGTGTVVPKHLEAGTTSPTEATDSVEPKKGIAISTAANGVVNIGLDSDTRGIIDNAASKDYVTTELANLNTTITGNANLNFAGNVTKDAQDKDADKVGLALATGTLHIKGDATDITTTAKGDTVTIGLTPETKGKLTAVGNLANVIGGTTITTDGTVTGPTFNITNATGGTDTANTLKDAIDKLNKTNEGQNTTISNLTTTVTNNYNDLSNKITNAGTAATAAATTKGLNFTGDDTTDNGKVHRDLGDTLTIKGGENFARGASENNIKVVKTSNDLAVKLAENLGNIKEIAGDGKTDLVIKNGDTKVTVKAPKDGNTGSIDFGNTKLVTNNLDANISYKAGTETDKNTVKLQDGFNFVAGTGTVAATTPATGATTTTSPTASTDNKAAKKGIVISTEANGVVNIGLDSDTRSAIDNAASKNYVENALTNLNSTITGNANLNFAGNVTKDAQDKDADKVGLSLATGTLHIKGDATDITTTAKNDTVTIGLTDTTKNKLKAIGNLATVIGGTTINTDGTVTGPTFNITNAAGGTDSATTLKDAIDKLNKTNEGQNTTISNLTTTVTNNYNDLSNKITNAGTAATAAATTKGLNFTGDDTTDNGKVHRDLGETLTIKGGENFTRGTSENNIKVVKNNNDLDVKLAENLGNIKEIAGDGTHDLVIKNGDTKVTVKAPKDGNKGSIDFGDTKLVANNLDANISYKAGTETNKNTVKLQDGFNFVAGTGTVVPKHLEAGTTSPTEATDSVEPKKGIAISTAANGVVNIGLDSDTRGIIDNAASKDYVTTELANLNTTITGNANLNFAGNVTKDAQDADVAKVGLALATGTLHIKGDATDITTTAKGDTVTIALTSAAQGKLTAVGNLASVIGGTTIAADGTVTGPTFNITNATGGTDSATTLKDAIDKLNKTNEGQNTTISNLTTTVTNNYNDLSNKITNAGTAATAAATTKGLNFTGDDTTDNGKVHRDLGETLTIKGGENFTRGTSENNIKVVKNNNDLDVKLAENLGNIKEISGDGSNDLVIKNGDTKVTVKAPKDGNTGSIDFGDTKLVTKNLDADIAYKAGTETAKRTVKLQTGFTFVAGDGTVAATTPATGATTPAAGTATTTSPTASTDDKTAKKGIVISTENNGVVNIGLDSDTRSAIDNAASKNYVENALTNLNTTITNNTNLNFAGNVTKDGQDHDTDKVGLALATGTLHIKGDATDITTTAKGDTVEIALTKALQDKLKQLGDTSADGRDGKSATSTPGASGTAGAAGAAGTSGTGTAGAPGASGTSGAAGTSGTSGTGTAGAPGASGTPGAAGASGTSGAAGAAGTSGTGAAGAPGASGTPGTTAPASAGSTGLTGADGLNGHTLTDKVNALRNGEAGTVVYTDDKGERLQKGNDGKYYYPTDLKPDGTVKTAAENNGKEPKPVDNPQARIVNSSGDTKIPTTFSNIADGKVEAGSHDAVNGGQLYTVKTDLTNAGLDFYGNEDTKDEFKVHRNLGQVLKIKGAGNFERAATATNNINVVKNSTGDGFDIQLAKNLGNIEEIAGDKTHDLVIKNGDTKVTVKAPKDGDKGSIDFGNTKLVTNNLEADIAYKAGGETAKKTVKLQTGFTFVAGDGTVASTTPAAGATTPAAGTATTTSPTASTDDKTAKKGIVISTEANGVVNIGLDSDTRSAIDNAASKSEVNTAITNLGTRITNLVDGGMTFIGDDKTADTVTRKLGETLNIHGQNNITVKKDATDATTLNVKLASDLKNITSITNADASGKPGTTISIGGDSVTITNTQAPATGTGTGDTKTVTIGKNGINAGGMNITNVGAATQDGDAVNKQYVDTEIKTLSKTIANNSNLRYAGDTNVGAATGEDHLNLALATGTLKVAGTANQVKTVGNAGTITISLDQAVTDKLAQLSNKNADGRDGKLGSEANAIASAGIAKADGLNGATATYKVNALRHGEAGSVVYTDADGNRIVKATDGNYYKATEVNANGVVKTPAENNGVTPVAVDKATIVATLVNANGTTAPAADDTNKVATTKLTNIKEAAITATSNDAVTGRQLYGLKSDLSTYLGGGSKVNADGTFTGPTYNITKDDESNTTEEAKNVGAAISKLDTRINNANSTLSTKGLDFYGNKDTVDTDKVHRNLGETLKLKGAGNFERAATATNNIDVVKNAAGDGFDIKLAENLANIKEISGDGKTDLVIKNGEATITLKPATADKTNPDTGVVTPGKTATVDFGKSKVVAENLDTDITYRANSVADTAAHKVKLQKGLNFVAGTGTVAQPAASTTPATTGGATTPATPPATDSETTKSGIVITTGDNGLVTIGLDSDTRNAIDNAANKDLSNLSQTGKDQVTALAKAAAKAVVKVDHGKNTTVKPKQDGDVTTYVVDAYDTRVAVSGTELTISGGEPDTDNVRTYTLGLSDDVKNKLTAVTNVGNTTSDGRDGKSATGTDGAAAAGGKGLTGKDGLNGSTLTDKVNALRNGEAGSVVYTNEAGERLIKANDGNYYKPSEVNADGSVKTQAENNNVAPTPVANPQARIVNGNGDTTTPTTLSNIADGKIADGSHDAVNGGQLNTVKTDLTKAGLDFTGDDTTDKVHRDLGTTLTIKGGENFTRATNENNIKVVKKTDKGVDRLDVQLAENLGNMKGISGNGTDSLVIKNGDATITLTPAKVAETDPTTGTTTPAKTATVDFGDSNVVAKNLDASIKYRANDDAVGNAKSVKLADGFNFVVSKDTTTATDGPKSGLAITAEDNGKVTFGLDKDTRSKIDNTADKDLSNLTTAGKKVITDAAQGAVKVKAGNNVTIDTETKDNVTTYTVNGRDTTVQAATGGSVSVTGGNLTATGERAYTVDLTEATKTQINRIDGIDTRLGTAEGNITTLQQAVQGGRVFAADTGATPATVALGETLAIKGGATGALIDGNIGVELIKANDTSPTTMMIRLKKDMDMQGGSTSYDHYMDKNGTPVKVATTKVDGTGVTITPVKGLNKPSVSLTADGLDNGGNPIHNVGTGTDPHDAATVGQVNAVAGAVSQRVNNIGAHAAALAAMNPLSYDPLKKSQVMAGYGSYKGNSALALGVAHYANEDTLFNVGVSVGNGENMVNAGITYRFGGEDSMIPERYKGGPISSVYVMQDEITALKAENARKDVENAKKQAENEEMKAQIKMLIERVTMLEAKK